MPASPGNANSPDTHQPRLLASRRDASTAQPMTHIVMVAPHGHRAGGAEVHLLELSKGLAEHGDRVTIIHRTPDRDVLDGVAFVYVPRNIDAGSILSELSPDIAHVHGDGLGPDEAAAQLGRTPVVRSLHDWSMGCSTGTLLRRGNAACQRAHGPGCLLHILDHSCTERPNPLPALTRWRTLGAAREQVREATAVIVYSEYAREIAIRNGVVPGRCHVLPYFVAPLPDISPPPGNGRVCVVGRLTKLKGVHLLLQALARSRMVTHLEVVGDGYYRDTLEVLAHRLGIFSRVTFSGWLDGRATRFAMQNADLVAVPSLWPEPFGIVGLEAMAASRAVIASGSGGIPEWLANGQTGRIVGSHDVESWALTLDEVLEDQSALARWGAAGARAVGRFSRQQHICRLRTLYTDLMTV